MEKKELRRLALQKRGSLRPEERQIKDALIARRLTSLAVFRKSRHILIYYSVKSEAGTLDVIKKWMKRKCFYLPRLTSNELFLPLSFDSLEALKNNAYGIPEPALPKPKPRIEPKLDLIIVPGVAFDRQGNRLGMGKGYYDRFLAAHEGVPKVAIAYSEQVLDRVPHKPYDEPVDMIITEKEIIRCEVSP